MTDSVLATATTPALAAFRLIKMYEESDSRVEVLKDVSFTVERGEMIAIVGASGSGKSTLLHILGLLDTPTSGSVSVGGESSHGLSEARKSALRNHNLGFIYQFHHLLTEFSALDNVAMPLIVRRESRAAARERAREVIELVGLGHRIGHSPGQLSGGERQRVALARALVTRPMCVLADEPTGNLDHETAQKMFELLSRVNRESGTAFAIVTHDPELAARTDRQLVMESGRLLSA